MATSCRLAIFVWILTLTCNAQLPDVTLENSQRGEFFRDGGEISLSCHSSATVTEFHWAKDGLNISASSNYVLTSSSQNSSLRIPSFNAALAGRYTCVADTEVGRISSEYVTLRRAFIEASYFSSSFSNPHVVRVPEGVQATVSCGSFVSEPAVSVTWDVSITFNFLQPLTVSHEVAYRDGNLLLVEPSTSRSGTVYRCLAQNGVINAQSVGYVRVDVIAPLPLYPPLEVLVPPVSQTFLEGDTVFFYCVPSGYGASQVDVTWSSTGSQPFIDSPSKFVAILTNTDSRAVGTITCRVNNTIERSAELSIIEPPELTSPLSPVSLTYGRTLTLICGVSLQEGVSWDWYFNGTWLSREGHSVLTRHSVTLEDHGIYQCIVRNSAGFRKSAALVEVNVIGASFVRPLPADILAYKGLQFTLGCNASGSPPPRYEWTKLSGNPAYDATDGQLVIAEVGVDHSGRYRCRASTVLSDDRVYSSVENVTNIQVIDPTIVTSQNTPLYEAQLLTTASFLCTANHSSAAVVDLTWTRDGQRVLQGGRVELRGVADGEELVISDVRQEDEGRYQCVVRTRVGELEAPLVTTTTTEFRVIDTAVIPEIHQVNATSPNSFELSWSFRGDMNQVAYYLIRVSTAATPSSDPVVVERRSVDAVTKAEVSSSALLPYEDYMVVVVVVFHDNTNIAAMVSDPVTVKTGVAVPLDPPRDFTATTKGANTIQLTWKAPSNPRGPIMNYSVRYRSTDSNTSFTMAMVAGTTQSYDINDLESFKEYEVQVAAVTSAGKGPYTVLLNAKFLTLPFSDSASFVNSVGFIVLVVVVLLTGIVVACILVLLWRRKRRSQKDRTYSFRHSFKAGISVGAEQTDDPFTDQQVLASYMNRHKRAFSSSSPTSPRSQDVPAGLTALENESSFGGTEMTASTQVISTTGSTSMVPRLQSPPGYIDPPGLTPADRLRRSRSPSSYSGREDYVFMQPVGCPSVSPSSLKKDQAEFNYRDDIDDVFSNKEPLESSSSSSSSSATNEGTEKEVDEDGLEGSHYSHLASQNSSSLPPSPNYPDYASPPAYPGKQGVFVNNAAAANGHSPSLAYGRSRSDGKVRRGGRGGGGVPDGGHYIEMKAPGMRQQVSVGQLVDHRLRSQSASDGIGKYDTYV